MTCVCAFVILCYVSCAKTRKSHLKVEARRAARSTRSTKAHANSRRICVYKAQKDCSGCGACRMATVYRSLRTDCSDQKPNKNTPRHRGVFIWLRYSFVGGAIPFSFSAASNASDSFASSIPPLGFLISLLISLPFT